MRSGLHEASQEVTRICYSISIDSRIWTTDSGERDLSKQPTRQGVCVVPDPASLPLVRAPQRLPAISSRRLLAQVQPRRAAVTNQREALQTALRQDLDEGGRSLHQATNSRANARRLDHWLQMIYRRLLKPSRMHSQTQIGPRLPKKSIVMTAMNLVSTHKRPHEMCNSGAWSPGHKGYKGTTVYKAK